MFKRKVPYSQEEVSNQIGIIAELMVQRDKTIFNKRDSEHDRSNEAIAAAQHVLNFMLDEIQEYNSKHATNRSRKPHRQVSTGHVGAGSNRVDQVAPKQPAVKVGK